jgi:hypothetical protein
MNTPPPLWRLILALFIAPAFPTALLASCFWFMASFRWSYLVHLWQIGPFAFAPALIFGLPTLLILYYGYVKPTAYRTMIIGGIIAISPWFVISISILFGSGFVVASYALILMFVAFLLGVMGGAIFYLFGVSDIRRLGARLDWRAS